MGGIKDPYGHNWTFATRKENLTVEEISVKQKEWLASMSQG